ncbi:hypothetical protein SAMN05192553_10619 [Cyclobacterium xiamenense]|uniref:Uncharacterized protein n=1 Tax=Cyclobacterium xiamenense TaxID=1297121 RepID=A0A1H7A4Y1_9BACT|nr:hypothetical protein [Cyclobacterium xiamenense]SEJ60641.1 hypothetical protein SAMN05192553_10619 [Cyclobacterium xiamenense]
MDTNGSAGCPGQRSRSQQAITNVVDLKDLLPSGKAIFPSKWSAFFNRNRLIWSMAAQKIDSLNVSDPEYGQPFYADYRTRKMGELLERVEGKVFIIRVKKAAVQPKRVQQQVPVEWYFGVRWFLT